MQGIEQFRRRLAALDRKTRGAVIRKALRAGAKLIQAAAKSRAPRSKGLLVKSIKLKAGKRKKDTLSMAVVATGGRASPFVGAIEYGTRKARPRPFMRPGFEASQAEATAAVFAEIKRGIESNRG